MKKSAFYFLLTLFLIGIFFKISSFSKASFENEPEGVSLPYAIEEKDWQGDLVSEKKGVSSGEDESEVVESLGYTLYPEDKLSAFPEMKMNIGSKISITRAPVIFLKDGKKRFEFRSWKKTVRELLEEKNVELGEDDKINFSTDTFLENGMQLVIVRVAITTIIEPKTIEYKTVKKNNPNLEKGNKNTLQKGANGKKNEFYLVTREDGEEISRKYIKSEVVEEPTEEIIEIGTKIVTYGTGKATWYIDTSEMIAAHNSLPRGTKVNVVNASNGKSVVVTIKGGGIQHDDNVIIDLSTAAFKALGATLGTGKLSNIRIEKYYPME